MVVLPSDQVIFNESAFIDAIDTARKAADDKKLITIGIQPNRPETGYGYIRRGEAVGDGFRVERFVEKPDLQTALQFIADGGYAWNGGIFAFRAGRFLEELARHRPDMAARTKQAFDSGQHADTTIRPDDALFAAVEGESVDYAIMENTDRAAMVDVSMGWSDIGNWDALFQKRLSPSQENVIAGPGEIIGARGSMIDSDGPHVTLVGADDVVVVVNGDDVLVSARSAVQRVGEASRCRKQ